MIHVNMLKIFLFEAPKSTLEIAKINNCYYTIKVIRIQLKMCLMTVEALMKHF